MQKINLILNYYKIEIIIVAILIIHNRFKHCSYKMAITYVYQEDNETEELFDCDL